MSQKVFYRHFATFRLRNVMKSNGPCYTKFHKNNTDTHDDFWLLSLRYLLKPVIEEFSFLFG